MTEKVNKIEGGDLGKAILELKKDPVGEFLEKFLPVL